MTQGFSQIYEVDYQEMFISTVCRKSLRMFLAVVTLYNMKLHQINVKAAYLSSELECEGENIYMHISEGVTIQEQPGVKIVCWIVKGLYGLKQSAQLCHKKLIGLMLEEGFYTLNTDLSILI